MKNYSKIINKIYKAYNPAEIGEIPELLEKHKGHEETFLNEIKEKFNIKQKINLLKLFNIILLSYIVIVVFKEFIIFFNQTQFFILRITWIMYIIGLICIILLNLNKGIKFPLDHLSKIFIIIFCSIFALFSAYWLLRIKYHFNRDIIQDLRILYHSFSSSRLMFMRSFVFLVFYISIALVNLIGSFKRNQVIRLNNKSTGTVIIVIILFCIVNILYMKI